MSFIEDTRKLFREHVRDYGMYIALLAIVVYFTIPTNGLFISPRNIFNLVNQTGYIAVIAIGMTLVIVIRHIDLSVGFLAGFLGAVAALGLVQYELPVVVVIPAVLFFGILAGRLMSLMVANLGIPAFVATLAGWLGYRGALQLVTRSPGTIVIPNDTFNAIGNGFIPELVTTSFMSEVHKSTLFIGLLAILVFVAGDVAKRNRMKRQNTEVSSTAMFTLKLAGGIPAYRRRHLDTSWISWSFLDRRLCASFGKYLPLHTTQTVLGRHIYAVGEILRRLN